MAVPAGTIRVQGPPHDLRSVATMVHRHGAVAVVVGHPLLLSGQAGESARRAEAFAEGLRAILDVPVHLQDERLSTVEAERGLAAGGASGRERRRAVDAAAAALILDTFLSRRRA